jgi:hypothetical protein
MIKYQKKFIRIAEYWNGEEAGEPKVDLMRFFQQSEPLAGTYCREFYTILLDLRQNSDVLLANIKKGTRYEIRRAAMSDGLIYETWNGKEPRVFNEFCEYYDHFAAQKAQPKQNRVWLSLLANADALIISRIRELTGEILVWHAYHRSPDRVTLLYSASVFRDNPDSFYRNRVGRANRFHHWQDMLLFKNQEVSKYDFGGWYEGKEDLQRLSINKFKEEFGGVIVKNYICERARTLRGRVFLLARRVVLGNAI